VPRQRPTGGNVDQREQHKAQQEEHGDGLQQPTSDVVSHITSHKEVW
jgi:hypothetical protein